MRLTNVYHDDIFSVYNCAPVYSNISFMGELIWSSGRMA